MKNSNDDDSNRPPRRDFFSQEALFPDYTPKTTPDTIVDYLGEKGSRLLEELNLPSINLDNLGILVELFKKYKRLAMEHPGHFKPGNPILGGPLDEFVPSDDEHLLSEIGNAIISLV
ncbi:MAG: hypothetical protein ACTSUK_06450, partial [Promethearchaeota archaeon]